MSYLVAIAAIIWALRESALTDRFVRRLILESLDTETGLTGLDLSERLGPGFGVGRLYCALRRLEEEGEVRCLDHLECPRRFVRSYSGPITKNMDDESIEKGAQR